MAYVPEYAAQSFPDKAVGDVFALSTLYLRSKAAFMTNVKVAVLTEESELTEALQKNAHVSSHCTKLQRSSIRQGLVQ